jgi:hypothetical protein
MDALNQKHDGQNGKRYEKGSKKHGGADLRMTARYSLAQCACSLPFC